MLDKAKWYIQALVYNGELPVCYIVFQAYQLGVLFDPRGFPEYLEIFPHAIFNPTTRHEHAPDECVKLQTYEVAISPNTADFMDTSSPGAISSRACRIFPSWKWVMPQSIRDAVNM